MNVHISIFLFEIDFWGSENSHSKSSVCETTKVPWITFKEVKNRK
jgi:hypothetical protein